MATDQQVYELHRALKEVIAELEGRWPVKYERRRKSTVQHMKGYSRERGRRPIIEGDA